MNTLRRFALLPLLASVLALAGCRGMVSEKPPIHPNLNMDFQEKFEPQEANPLFADGRANRPTVAGTVARGLMKENTAFQTGRQGGALVRTNPLPITQEVLLRGQQRYAIQCAVCHGNAGDGKGVVGVGGYGWVVPTYHDDRLRAVEDGHFYDVIVNGIRTMPAYGHQISVADRWAIVAYIRALQLSQHAQQGQLPADVLARIGAPASGAPSGGAPLAADTTN